MQLQQKCDSERKVIAQCRFVKAKEGQIYEEKKNYRTNEISPKYNKYAKKYGVSHAARVYKINRTNIYRWKNRYNGTLESLRNFPTIPKSHPKQHTQNEIKLIKDMFRKNKDTGLVTFWLKIKT